MGGGSVLYPAVRPSVRPSSTHGSFNDAAHRHLTVSNGTVMANGDGKGCGMTCCSLTGRTEENHENPKCG